MNPPVRMPFGKYKGVRVEDLDSDYCQNILDRWKGPMGESLRAALKERIALKAQEVSR